LRKVYDAYLEFYDKDWQEYDLHKTLWIAKIAYQEKRNQWGLPSGFSKFIEEVDNLLGDKELFKKFLEMFVAYHKYFNPNAK
jgi:CRISPR/Cas system CSM-associated protein Csm2 small subunit